jgi:alginate lyase
VAWANTQSIWLSHDQIKALPQSGPAWEAMQNWSSRTLKNPSLANQNDPSSAIVLARALIAVSTDDQKFAEEVRQICARIQGTESGATALAVSREISAYVIAASLVGLPPDEDSKFRFWLQALLHKELSGRSIVSTHNDRPNNWGTHAGAARIAIAAYLDDKNEVQRAADVFRGWLGEADGWQKFEFGDRGWQPDTRRNYAINPAGSTIKGFPVGGVLPDDQRRGGSFRWPPPKENYVYEALQGAVLQAMLLENQGYDPWMWGDSALKRAFTWLDVEADYSATGDDTWMPYVINAAYGIQLPTTSPSSPGKTIGFTDWIYHPDNPKPPIVKP